MNTEALTTNLLTIAVEVLAILFAFTLLNWLLGRLLRSLSSVPAFERFKQGAGVLRRRLSLFLMLVALLVAVALVSVNLYLMYQGEDLLEYTVGLIRGIPRTFWIDAGIAAGEVVALLIVTAVLLRFATRALDFA